MQLGAVGKGGMDCKGGGFYGWGRMPYTSGTIFTTCINGVR